MQAAGSGSSPPDPTSEGAFGAALPPGASPQAQAARPQSAREPIVRFENVGLRYGTEREVLSDISFQLHRGRFYFLTGPSGAGKTSLLRLLYLAQSPSRGEMSLFGEDAAHLERAARPALRRRIGVVFQDFRLVPHLTVYDNIALPLRLAGVSEDEMNGPVDDMIDWVGLGASRDARPETLSGGGQQRVAIARAVITRPDLLVADEPTGNVDPDMAVRLLRLFGAMNRLGTTVVLATHDMTLMGRMKDAAVMRLERGRLTDPTGALRNPPHSWSPQRNGDPW